MAISFYDISIGSYLQTVGAVVGFLEKGRTHLEAQGVDLNDVVQTRLIDDMLPFSFQVHSVVHHSLGAIKGIEAGAFRPPADLEDLDYQGLQKKVSDALAALGSYTRTDVDKRENADLVFQIGDRKMPFTASGFVLSFSLPNLHFHAATAYDILRMKGVPLGKRDYMGRLQMKG